MKNNFIKEYLSFSRKERIGVYTLLILIVIVAILPNFYGYFIRQKVYDSSVFDWELAQLTIQEGDSSETNCFEANYDISKIWGLRAADVKRLIPLIRIEKETEKMPDSKPEYKELKKETIIAGSGGIFEWMGRFTI